MRVLLLLFISGFLLSQPINKVDSIKPVDMPEDIKPTVDNIVANSQEIRKLEEATSREMQKQLKLMLEIKAKVLELKRLSKIKQNNKEELKTTDSSKGNATKEQDMLIEVEGKIVQWETRKRTWLGRLLNTEEILYYPFIVDEDGNKIYLKK